MNALDRLARAVGEPAAREDTSRMTRRDLATRGGLALFSLGAIGHLGFPQLAAAAGSTCTRVALAACLAAANQAGSDAYTACLRTKTCKRFSDPFCDLDCLIWDGQRAVREAQRKCFAKCPPPKPPRRKPPSRSGKAKAPPQLPPNPYDNIGAACADCAAVGGVCCFGGQDLVPGLCACATAGVECRVYGC